MKKNILVIACAVFSFYSCSKTEIPEPTSLTAEVSSNVSVDLSKCKIRRIYQMDFNGYVSALFTYNHAGNPYSVIYSDGGTGVNDHHFYYDSKNRLIRYELAWVGYVTEDHYYSYNAAGQIGKDSMRFFNCCGVLDAINVSAIEYDYKGRVVRETIVNKYLSEGQTPGWIRRPTYTYDSRGNLAVAGWKSSSYDYKINPLRQNPIFQFIHRNYSMNNAAVQPKYNSIGLPLSIKPSNDYFFNNFETLKVIYDCQ